MPPLSQTRFPADFGGGDTNRVAAATRDELSHTGVSSTEKHDVHVGPKAHVISQVPSDVVGVLVNDDLVAGPVPAVAIGNFSRSDTEIESAEPEAAWAAARQVPYVPGAKAATEVSVFPGMVKVKRCVGVLMPHPDVALRCSVDVRDVGVPGLIGKIPLALGRGSIITPWRRASPGNRPRLGVFLSRTGPLGTH